MDKSFVFFFRPNLQTYWKINPTCKQIEEALRTWSLHTQLTNHWKINCNPKELTLWFNGISLPPLPTVTAVRCVSTWHGLWCPHYFRLYHVPGWWILMMNKVECWCFCCLFPLSFSFLLEYAFGFSLEYANRIIYIQVYYLMFISMLIFYLYFRWMDLYNSLYM